MGDEDEPCWGWLAFGFCMGFIFGLLTAALMMWLVIITITEGP